MDEQRPAKWYVTKADDDKDKVWGVYTSDLMPVEADEYDLAVKEREELRARLRRAISYAEYCWHQGHIGEPCLTWEQYQQA